VTVPVSAGLLTDTRSCFAALTAYRDGDVAPIVDAMSGAAHASIVNGRTLVGDLRAAGEAWAAKVKARSDSAVWPLVDLVLRQPVVNTAVVQAQLGVNRRALIEGALLRHQARRLSAS
jgi:hypothetical protein